MVRQKFIYNFYNYCKRRRILEKEYLGINKVPLGTRNFKEIEPNIYDNKSQRKLCDINQAVKNGGKL